ncbi:MAG: S-methyl-5-thioribose-1-phosphate isomerase [Candidatus Zixiibacteriota bacterium]|nr:MAG: S-methyl-5-thioribose-1-phosphate isomerase [candidate division Zixibacteria bacterium]
MNFKTIEKIPNGIRIIDQTRLPVELIYETLTDIESVIRAIKRLEVRGAPAIGIAAAYGLALAVENEKRFDAEFVNSLAEQLKASRPTAVNLFWAIDRMLQKFNSNTFQNIDEATEILWVEAIAIHKEDELLCKKIGKNGSSLIKDGDTVLTHCNAGALATGGIGTALGVIYTCRDQGKKLHVFADETRPLLQGSRLTVWELQQENIPVTLICDNMAGMVMSQGKIDHIIVGADRIAKNGDFANKIGTYSVAVLAKEHNIPFYVAAPYSTFDENISDGSKIEIELRSSDEIINGFGKQTAPSNTNTYSPAFDVTPYDLVSYYISDVEIKPGGRSQ